MDSKDKHVHNKIYAHIVSALKYYKDSIWIALAENHGKKYGKCS